MRHHPSNSAVRSRRSPLAILAAGMLAAQLAPATSSLPITDHFPYASSGNLGSVGTAGGWSGSSSAVVMNAGNLDGTGIGAPASSGNMAAMTSSTGSTYLLFATASGDITTGKVYCSMLLKVTDATSVSTTGERAISMNIQNGSSTRYVEIYFKNVSGAVQLGLAKNGGTATYITSGAGSNVADGSVHLVVFSQEFVSPGTSDDIVKLWVDPASQGGAEDGSPAVTINTGTDITSSTGTGRLYFSGGVVCNFDLLRMGTAWSDVTGGGAPLVGTKLAFTTQPAGAAPGATMSPVVVRVQTSGGANVASNGVPITLTHTAGAGTLSGTLTQNTDATGTATFSNLSIDTAGGGNQLTATASGIGAGLTAAVSTTFTIADPSVAAKLAFTTQPSDALIGASLGSVVVQVQDASNVAVATNGIAVTVTLSAGTGTLGGTATQNTDSTGKATFSDLSVDTAGTGKQLGASASGLTGATSSTFTITAGGGGGSPGLNVSQTRMLSTGYEVNGTNGTVSTFAQIVGSPNLNVPFSNWMLVAYGNINGSGNITFTNPVSPALPNAYYRLRTGNTSTKLEPPSILSPPQSQIVSPGATATFTVGAVGPLLQYLWHFNGAPIKNATNSSLVIPNAQAGNVGNYHVIVANPGGSATSPVATLGVGNVGPTITAHPVDQNVTAGNTALFTVAATGTSPLTYQWYFNTNTPVPAGTNATLTLTGVTTNDAGKYACTVANGFGTAGSSNATLSIAPTPSGLPNTNALGWAAYAGVTGGEFGGSTTSVTCADYASFSNAVRNVNPLIIYVDGWITNTEAYCYIYGPNKSIIGLGTNSGFFGDLRVNATNVIIRNLSFAGTLNNSDLITIDGGSKGTGKIVWVDHCTFYDAPDGSIDITKGADYVTVSWCKFSYAYAPPGNTSHEYVNLIGSSDSDNLVNFHVTFHHNWWGDHCRERMPSVRFGRVHVFNNYYNCTYNNYCIRTRLYAEVLAENNYFIGVQNPWERLTTGAGGDPGLLKATGNITNNCTWSSTWYPGVTLIPGTDTLGSDLNPPPYSYTLDTAADVPYYIQTYAGHGKYPFGP